MINGAEPPQLSLRNNIMIVFFLVAIIGGVTFTILFQNVIQTTLVQEGLEKTVIENITRNFTFILTGLTMASIFIALLVALLLSNTITKPIESLAKGVAEVASGKLDARIDVVRQDEFGQLADSFNRMTENLKKSKDVLRHKSKQLEASTKDLRTLSTQLVKEEELSRKKFAKVLHEQMGQNLAAIMIKCDRLVEETNLGEREMREAISGLLPLLNDTIRSMRELTSDLYPTILDDLGFIPAVTWCRDLILKPKGIRVTLGINKFVEDLPSESKLSLFRIVQEAFQNIAKHASAEEVKVALKKKKDSMKLSIQDNGNGFNSEEVEKKVGKGIGLMLMKERALSIGGGFTLESAVGEGTELIVEIPLMKEK